MAVIPVGDDVETRRLPLVTVALITTCGIVFLIQDGFESGNAMAMINRYGFVPATVAYDGLSLLTLISALFLHGGWLHLVGNMLYLWLFGSTIEDALGHVGFFVFYMLCGIFGSLGHAIAEPLSTLPMIGASGAISGVLGAYLVLHPHARVRLLLYLGIMFKTVQLSAFVVICFWIVLQLIEAASVPLKGGGVAVFAHIGGFLAGVGLAGLYRLANFQR
ncbi:MAG: rhomboid family intramembrane serine protease [Alphaproteobacteria bacterium]|nr:rhomboid family intramembrane serine protease [Alphaproteobacteria bacterium]